MNLYQIKNLTFAYPDIASERDDRFLAPSLQGIHLTIEQGSFVVVAGGSGSGKTTLLRQLKSCLAPRGKRSGSIEFLGKRLDEIERNVQTKKIGFVLQDVDAQLVTDKVWHELAFGLESLSYENAFIRKRVSEMSSFFGLNDIFHKKVNELSGGQKQLVNLASVMAMAPEVIILDEPASQLDPMAARDFFQCLHRINRELGTTIIITEHRLEELWSMCSQFVLMDAGKIIYDGKMEDGILKLYESVTSIEVPAACRIAIGLGEQGAIPITVAEGRRWLTEYDACHEQTGKKGIIEKQSETERPGKTEKQSETEKSDENRKSGDAGQPGNKKKILDVKDIFFRYDKMDKDVLRGLSLSVYENEMLAVNGCNGCGKSTLLSLLAGVHTPYRGKIKKEKGARIGLLPQDAKLLFTENTVYRELGSATSAREKIVSLCHLESLLDRHPYDLSGGEQQRLGLAKVLLGMPDIILMDEPTKGMDASFKRVFSDILMELQKQGRTIVLVSHDIEFCAQTADRVCLLFDGETATVQKTADYFTGNEFYTTAAARIAKNIVKDAFTVQQVLEAYGVKPTKENADKDSADKGSTCKSSADKKNTDKGSADKGKTKKNEKDEDESEKVNHDIDKTGSADKGNTDKGGTDKTNPISLLCKIGLVLTFLVMAFCFYKTVSQEDLTRLISDGAVTTEGVRYICLYGIFIAAIAAFIGLLRPIGKAKDREIELQKKNRYSRKNIIITTGCILAVLLTIWIGKAILSDRKYYFISLLVLIEMMIPFAAAFENRKPTARDLVTVAVLCALAATGRIAFFMIPNFNPVVAIVIISGVAFGCETGFVTGAVTMLVSNMVFGQGPWTPWQMFAMGLVGFAAGLVFNNSHVRTRMVTKLGLCVFGGLCSIVIYGGIMNPASVIMWQPAVNMKMIIAAYVTGFPFDVVQGFATALFLWIMAGPFLEKLDRIKIKYGVLCEKQKDISQDAIPGIDMEKGLSYIGNSIELYRTLLETYLDGSEERIQKLEDSKKCGDIRTYDAAIHSLKGVSASIGADEMAKTAAGLEDACRNSADAMKYIRRHHKGAIKQYRELLEHIKKWLANTESDDKIEGKRTAPITEILETIVNMKKAVFEYREKDACAYLEDLYHAEAPEIQKNMGEQYFEILNILSKSIENYEMDEAYEQVKTFETDIRRMIL